MPKKIEREDYKKLDNEIVAVLAGEKDPIDFASIFAHASVGVTCEEIANASFPKREASRVLDGRLQALRKEKRIEFIKWSGKGWRIAQ